MSKAANLVKDYNESGLSIVLDAAKDLVERASRLLFQCSVSTPPAAEAAFKREAAVCLAEAEELIAAVRKEGGL